MARFFITKVSLLRSCFFFVLRCLTVVEHSATACFLMRLLRRSAPRNDANYYETVLKNTVRLGRNARQFANSPTNGILRLGGAAEWQSRNEIDGVG